VFHRKPPTRPSSCPRGDGRRLGQRPDAGSAESGDRHRHWLEAGLILGGAASLTTLGAVNGFLLGEIAGPILAATGLHGLWRGGLCKLLMLPVWCSLVFLVALRPGLPDLFVGPAAGSAGLAGNAILCLVLLLGALIIAGRAARAIRRRVMVERRPGVLALDRLLGAAFGTAQGLCILLALCWAMVLIEPQARAVLHHPNMPEQSAGRRIAAGIVRLTQEINQTPLESMAHEANLLERVPFIRNALCDLAEGQRLALDSTTTARSKWRIETPPGGEPERRVQPRPALTGTQVSSKVSDDRFVPPTQKTARHAMSLPPPRDGAGGYRQLSAHGLAGRATQSTLGGGS